MEPTKSEYQDAKTFVIKEKRGCIRKDPKFTVIMGDQRLSRAISVPVKHFDCAFARICGQDVGIYLRDGQLFADRVVE